MHGDKLTLVKKSDNYFLRSPDESNMEDKNSIFLDGRRSRVVRSLLNQQPRPAHHVQHWLLVGLAIPAHAGGFAAQAALQLLIQLEQEEGKQF